MIRRPPRSTQSRSSAASDVYKRQDIVRLRRRGMVGALDDESGSNFGCVSLSQHISKRRGHQNVDIERQKFIVAYPLAVGMLHNGSPVGQLFLQFIYIQAVVRLNSAFDVAHRDD